MKAAAFDITLVLDKEYVPGKRSSDSFDILDGKSDTFKVQHRKNPSISGTVNGVVFSYSPYFDDGEIRTIFSLNRSIVKAVIQEYYRGNVTPQYL